MRSRLRRRHQLPYLAGPALALGSTALCLFGIEIAGRASMVGDRFYVWPPNIEITYEPVPGVMPGINGVSILRTSSLGLRSDEMPENDDVYRVLAVGGSTTESSFLDQSEAWPHLVQEILNDAGRGPHWVGNLGASGKNSRDHVLQLKYRWWTSRNHCGSVVPATTRKCRGSPTTRSTRWLTVCNAITTSSLTRVADTASNVST